MSVGICGAAPRARGTDVESSWRAGALVLPRKGAAREAAGAARRLGKAAGLPATGHDLPAI